MLWEFLSTLNARTPWLERPSRAERHGPARARRAEDGEGLIPSRKSAMVTRYCSGGTQESDRPRGLRHRRLWFHARDHRGGHVIIRTQAAGPRPQA